MADSLPSAAPRPPTGDRITFSILLIGVAALALANLPYLWGAARRIDGQVFSGIADIHEDAYSYLAKMREGWEGRWSYDDRYTTEPHRPALVFEFYLALGHAARLTGLSLLAAYHLARIASSILLLFGIDRLVRALRVEGASRAWAFFFACFGQGLGWAAHLWRAAPPPIEQWLTEAYVHQTIANFPHLIFSTALLAWIFGDLARLASGAPRAAPLARIAVAAFALAWTHPRLSLSVGIVGCSAGLISWRRGETPLAPWLAGTASALAAAAVPSILILLSMRGDPVWARWSAIPTETPNPLLLLEGFGILWPLALWGAWLGLRDRRRWGVLLAVWLLTAALTPYLPFISQRRLIQGLGIPLGALAGIALAEGLLPWLRSRPAFGPRGAAGCAAALALFAALSPIWHARMLVRYCGSGSYPWRHSVERAAAMDWLRGNAKPGDVVLCSYDSGRMIPALAGARVVVGHWAETINLRPGKIADINAFFDLRTPAEARDAIARKYGANMVLVSSIERMIGGYDPAFEPGRWRAAWKSGGIAIYEAKNAGEDSPQRHRGTETIETSPATAPLLNDSSPP